ncbi:MAG: hypothetical protein ACHQ49_01590 [Elusimicrobiota bacterium]
MDTQPKIPTLKDSQKPQVKVRGLEAGVSLFDRLKQFKKKDLAFILAGLGTLFMAPLAEHFMMSPESGDGALHQGWGQNGNKGIFGDGSGGNPNEVGVNGMASGGPTGGGSDIITPLNVRDPSALVMGPGATQQPPTNSVMPSSPPPTAPPTHSDSELKDALAAGGRAAGAAAKAVKALVPVPKIALGGGPLRGLGVANGASSATAGLSAPGAAAGSSKGGGSNMPGVRGGSGIKGVTRGNEGNGADALSALKNAANNAADRFNRGEATKALSDAAAQGIPTGGGSFGGNGAGLPGSGDKGGGGNQDKSSKNVGESLAFLKMKAMQDAQIALWAEEQKAGDSKLEALKIRNTTAESLASTFATDMGKKVDACIFKGPKHGDCMGTGGATAYICTLNPVTEPPVNQSFSADLINEESNWQSACSHDTGGKDKVTEHASYILSGSDLRQCNGTVVNPIPVAVACVANGKTTAAKKGGSNPKAPDAFDGMNTATLGNLCKIAIDKGAKAPAEIKPYYDSLKAAAGQLVAVRDALFKGAGDADLATCGASPITLPEPQLDPSMTKDDGPNDASALEAAKKAQSMTVGKAADDASGAVAQMKPLVAENDQKSLDAISKQMPGADLLKKAVYHRAKASAVLAMMEQSGSPLNSVKTLDVEKLKAVKGVDNVKDAELYNGQLKGSQKELQDYENQLRIQVSNIKPYQDDLGAFAVADEKGGDPTLKRVVQTNVAFTGVANGSDLKPAKVDESADKKTAAVSLGNAVKPVTDAIEKAHTSVGDGKIVAATPSPAPAAAPAPTTAPDPKDATAAVNNYLQHKDDANAKATAQKYLDTANGDTQQMRDTQTAALNTDEKALLTVVLPPDPTTPGAPASASASTTAAFVKR